MTLDSAKLTIDSNYYGWSIYGGLLCENREHAGYVRQKRFNIGKHMRKQRSQREKAEKSGGQALGDPISNYNEDADPGLGTRQGRGPQG